MKCKIQCVVKCSGTKIQKLKEHLEILDDGRLVQICGPGEEAIGATTHEMGPGRALIVHRTIRSITNREGYFLDNRKCDQIVTELCFALFLKCSL